MLIYGGDAAVGGMLASPVTRRKCGCLVFCLGLVLCYEGLAGLTAHENLKIAERLRTDARTNMKVEIELWVSAEYGNERMGLFLLTSSLNERCSICERFAE
jgi:hypothetical protein